MPYPLLRLLLCLPLLTLACEKEPLDTLDELVPATQEGANTLGCLIDGEVFYNRGGSLNVQDIFGSSRSIPNKRISIVGREILSDGVANANSVIVRLTEPVLGSNSIFDPFDAYVERDNGGHETTYFVNTSMPYNVELSKLDEVDQIISGVFSFTVCDTITGDCKLIADGRFDVRYQ